MLNQGKSEMDYQCRGSRDWVYTMVHGGIMYCTVLLYASMILDPTCNKYYDLIGYTEVSIFHRKSCKLCRKSYKLRRKSCKIFFFAYG